jgi:hypothetical protein
MLLCFCSSSGLCRFGYRTLSHTRSTVPSRYFHRASLQAHALHDLVHKQPCSRSLTSLTSTLISLWRHTYSRTRLLFCINPLVRLHNLLLVNSSWEYILYVLDSLLQYNYDLLAICGVVASKAMSSTSCQEPRRRRRGRCEYPTLYRCVHSCVHALWTTS